MTSEKEMAKALMKHVAGQTILEADKLDEVDLLWSTLSIEVAGKQVTIRGDLRDGSFEEEFEVPKLRKLADEGKTKRKPNGSEQRSSTTEQSEDDLNQSEQSTKGSDSKSSESGAGDATEDAPLMTDSAKDKIQDALD